MLKKLGLSPKKKKSISKSLQNVSGQTSSGLPLDYNPPLITFESRSPSIESQSVKEDSQEEQYTQSEHYPESSYSNQSENIYENMEDDGNEQLRAAVAVLSTIAAVAIKPGQFKATNAEGWFVNLEAQFKLGGIERGSTKFNHVIANVPAEFLQPVSHIAYKSNVVEEDYEALKNALIAVHRESKMKRMSQLLDTAELGDQTPSQFYRFLKSRFSDKEMVVPKDLLYNRWLHKLPQAIQVPIAAAAPKMEEADWLQLADSVYDINGGFHQIAAINHGRNRSNSITSNSSYRSTNSNSSYRGRGRGNRNSTPRRGRFNPDGPSCWYHWKFGTKARKCHGDNCKFAKPKNESQ